MHALPRKMTVRLMTNLLVTEQAAAGLVGQSFPMKVGDTVFDEVTVLAARSLMPALGVDVELESASARLAAMVGDSEAHFLSVSPTVRRHA